MRVTLLFPENLYSTNKAKITKLRKVVGCAEKGSWTGSSWVGKALVIEADFAKAAMRLGIQREYDGDALVLSGDSELCKMFIDEAPKWGAEIQLENPESVVARTEVDESAPIRMFDARATAFGFSESFIRRWVGLMQRDMNNGITPVTS